MFDLVEKLDELPEWVKELPEKPRQIYELVEMRRKEIEQRVEAGEHLKGKQRKIVKSAMCEAAEVNPAYIAARDYPELFVYIDRTNEHLARLTAPTKVTSKALNKIEDGDIREMTKGQLEALVRKRNSYIKTLEQLLASNQLNVLKESGMLEGQREKAILINRLKQKNTSLLDELSKKTVELEKRSLDYLKSQETIRDLKQKITDLEASKRTNLKAVK